MRFDARAVPKLPSGEHMTFEGFPGLRLPGFNEPQVMDVSL
ncbi:hypothetical protein OKW30_006347 [Paraburkholderia sp. Clong3]